MPSRTHRRCSNWWSRCRARYGSGLSDGEVFEFLAARLGAPAARAVAAEVRRRTEGNPLYVSALVPALAALEFASLERAVARGRLQLPESLRHAVARRLRRLPEPCRHALRAAAILGREPHAQVLADVRAQLPDGDLERALAVACEEGVLQRDGADRARYRFAHALLVEVLCAELDTAERAELHVAAARALERRGEHRAPATAARVAQHWLAAGSRCGFERALERAGYCARAAQDRRAHAETAEALQLALAAVAGLEALPETAAGRPALRRRRRRAALLRELSAARFAGGELEAAREHLHEVTVIARALGDAELLSQATLDELGRDSNLAVPAEQLALCELACAALPKDASPTRVRLLSVIASRLCFTPDRSRGLELLREAERLAERCADRAASLAVFEARHLAAIGTRPLEARAELLAHWSELAEQQPGSRAALRVALWRVLYCMEAGDGAGMEQRMHAFERTARASCEPWPLWESQYLLCARALLSGRLAEAEQTIRVALETGQRAQAADAPGVFGLQLMELRRLQGRGGELLPALRLSAERNAHLPALRAVLAGLYAELGHTVEAKAELARAHRECLDAIEWLPALYPLRQLAHACAELDDAARARELHTVLLPYEVRCAAMVTGVVCDGSVAHHLGLAARTAGMHDRAAEHFETALAVNSRMSATPWVARTRYELARLLCKDAGEVPRARALAREALEASERIGMRDLARRARALCEALTASSARLAAAATAQPNATREGSDASLFRREGEHWSCATPGAACGCATVRACSTSRCCSRDPRGPCTSSI